jgi:CRISPR-associated exonuclease Cas4
MFWLFVLALTLLGLGRLSLSRSTTLRRESGLPPGRLIYVDAHQDWRPNDKALYSPTHNLTGKPDYVVETPTEIPKAIIPVEVKSTPAPEIPYLGHLLQLAAYCLLIEEATGRTPPHGLLKYADALYEVDFTQELRRELLDTMAEMRQDRLAENVKRNHHQPGKCLACGFRDVCEEALTW